MSDLALKTSNGRLIIGPPLVIIPLDAQFGVSEKRRLPEALDGWLFKDSLNVYAIIDAARICGLAEHLQAADVQFECLYSGAAAEDLREVAPYIVELSPKSEITRLLFTKAEPPLGWWGNYAAVFIRSPCPFEMVRRHFRKYTRLQNENKAWLLFRFWEGSSLITVMRHSSPQDQAAYFSLDHEYNVVRRMADGDIWTTMRWAS